MTSEYILQFFDDIEELNPDIEGEDETGRRLAHALERLAVLGGSAQRAARLAEADDLIVEGGLAVLMPGSRRKGERSLVRKGAG